MDRTVPDPSLQNTFMGATLDPLASDTWEEVSPEATTLLKPEDCKSLWMNIIEKIKLMVTGARSRQDGHRKTGSYAAAAAAAGAGAAAAAAAAAVAAAAGAAAGAAVAAAAAAGAVVAGPAAVLNAGVATFMGVMRL
ncbi:protein ROOT HAIR DEFECTIVE 3 homolog 2-like [Populus alba]|uniref:protein ROOT HAIR DEFECTIVE 3 homolog 2-like n=1 Tax=Populus alba TaxID=43335 RepID=UPI003CC7766F